MKKSKELFDKVSIECSSVITKSYSTSFSLGIKLLDKKYQKPIYAIYGFVRLADEIVDSFHDYEQRKLLDQFKSSTKNAIQDKISLNPILNSFQECVHAYNISWQLINTFLQSMYYDLENKNCNEETYKEYIKGSAEAVGLMCLKIFTQNKDEEYKKLEPYAISLGAAFQKINFLRDLKDDFNILNRTYFPDVNINKFNETDKKNIEDDIEKDFAHALIGIKKLNNYARNGVYLAYLYYTTLFKKIKRMKAETILEKRIRISNFKKIYLLLLLKIKPII
tara:strand:+ start:60 stop:896 length:837 start_codon:yes stop_codon:yes gene_type:complete